MRTVTVTALCHYMCYTVMLYNILAGVRFDENVFYIDFMECFRCSVSSSQCCL